MSTLSLSALRLSKSKKSGESLRDESMILIGTMNLTRTEDTGQFYCPNCRNHQEYRLRARRPFLTLYFVPVVPIGGKERFIDCRLCRQHWDVSVLELARRVHEEIQLEQFHGELFRASVLVTLADGDISEREIATLLTIADDLHVGPHNRDSLGQECSVARENGIEPLNFFRSVAPRWNQEQRSYALQTIFLAATAEGEMGDEQTKIVSSLRDIFDMTDREFEASIEEVIRQEEGEKG